MSQEVTLRPRGAQRLRGPSGKEKPGLPAPGLPAGGGHLRLAQGKREETTRSGATPVTLTLIESRGQRRPPVGNSAFISKSRLRGPRGPGRASRLCGSAVRAGEAGLPGLPGVPAAGQAVHVLLLDVLVTGLAGQGRG